MVWKDLKDCSVLRVLAETEELLVEKIQKYQKEYRGEGTRKYRYDIGYEM